MAELAEGEKYGVLNSTSSLQRALPAPCRVKDLRVLDQRALGDGVPETFVLERTSALPKICSQKTPSVISSALPMLRDKRGLLFAAFSAVFYSIKNVCMELVITNELDPFQMLVMVMPASTVGSLMWLVSNKIQPPKELPHYLWLLFSGSLFTSFVIFFALSLQNMDVGDAATVSFTSLIQVGILSWIVLREPIRLFDFGFAGLAFGGVVFVSRPSLIFGRDDDTNNNTALGVFFALMSSFSIALLCVVFRKQQQLGINTFVGIFANSIVVVAFSAVRCTTLKSWRCPTKREWIFVEFIGVVYFIAQAFAYCALLFESATLVVITTTLEIVFTFLLQFAFLSVVPAWTSYIGALLIMGSCVGIGLTTHRRQKREREERNET